MFRLRRGRSVLVVAGLAIVAITASSQEPQIRRTIRFDPNFSIVAPPDPEPGDAGSPGNDPEAGVPQVTAPDPECTYFVNQPQYSAAGPEMLRGNGDVEVAYSNATIAGALTDQVAHSLPKLGTGNPVSLGNPFVSRIDFRIFSVLQQKNIAPANLTTDAEFLRRATLDLTGRIPTPQQSADFAASTNPQKRSDTIDRLLNSPEWVDRWTMWLGDLLHNNSNSAQINRGTPGRDALQQYIRASVLQNKPYNQMVTELINGLGDSYTAGPANFILGGTMSMGPAQDTYDRQWVQAATMFLGVKHFDCLLCHDGAGHLDGVNLWGSHTTRAQAWGMAAFFSRTRITRPAGTTWTIAEAATGGYNLNTNSGNRPQRAASTAVRSPVLPRYLFSGRQLAAADNFRPILAQELTKDFQFARATVNYVWAHFFTVGIVDPPDAFDLDRLDPKLPPPAPWTLQPSNPELLDELARSFINSGYDLKALMREITNSQAYQLSSQYPGTWDPAYARLYARHLIRRLDSEELVDAIVQSSGVANNMTITLGSGATTVIPWAMQLPETTVPGGGVGNFLNNFLRGDRDENGRRGDVSTTQALALMNDAVVVNRVQSTAGWLSATLRLDAEQHAISPGNVSEHPIAQSHHGRVERRGSRSSRRVCAWTTPATSCGASTTK